MSTLKEQQLVLVEDEKISPDNHCKKCVFSAFSTQYPDYCNFSESYEHPLNCTHKSHWEIKKKERFFELDKGS